MMNKVHDVVVIGAGAAGLMCAVRLGERGVRTIVLEGQDRPARKLLVTGGGRCNITNAVVRDSDYATGCPRILRHVLKTFPSEKAVSFFAGKGVKLAAEEDGKYFVASGRAGDVAGMLVTAVEEVGGRILCRQRVDRVRFCEGLFVVETSGAAFQVRNVVVTTGGLSYPTTGSDGAGFEIAKNFGHTILPTLPALVPFLTNDRAYAALAGLTIPAAVSVWSGEKKISGREGSFLFTHTGFSGPVILDISRDWQGASGNRRLMVDFAPGVPADTLEARLADDDSRAVLITRLGEIIPRRLANFLVARAGIDPGISVHSFRRAERRRLGAMVKEHQIPVSGTAGFGKAEVTSGGVDLNELQGASLESKLQPGLFFAGEVLDVDGRVGGFNLQWAWASGVSAADGLVRKLKG